MRTCTKSKTSKLSFTAALILISFGAPGQALAKARVPARATVAVEEDSVRVNHARELLGKHYTRSIVKKVGEKIQDVDQFVYEQVQRTLPAQYKKLSKKISKAILTESERHSLDPVFLMAVIENESSFNPAAIGKDGEIGLMQLMPSTAEWFSKKLDIRWRGKKTLQDPITNIKIGAAYLASLRERFDFHGRLYLAAYNMGATNVRRALEKQVWPKDYAVRVMQRYVRMYAELTDAAEPTIGTAKKNKMN